MKRKKLKLARIKKDLKQSEIAEYLEISQARYSRIESGAGTPTLKQMQSLITLLKINASYF